MPYIPASTEQRQRMLKRLGLNTIEDLFTEIPQELRFPTLGLETELSEEEVLREIRTMADKNSHADTVTCFIGAGAYNHFIPSAVSYLASRSEFMTSYTPYQPEVSQGTLQAIFEFQSMLASLTGMDVINAGHYDGATALAEGIIMALRNSTAKKILIPEQLHPEYKDVIRSYLSAFDAEVQEYQGTAREAAAPYAAVQGELAALVSAYPDFYGQIPELDGAAEAAHKAGALFIVHTDPIMLGLFKNPGSWGADICTAEGQSLGNDLNAGGPFLGIMGCTTALVRKLPGRLVGQAFDHQNRRGYVLTLVAREQHIRREKAVSNICSNQGLAALRSCIYLALMGKQGLKEAAELCWHKAHYASGRIAALKGFSVSRNVFFKEFLVECPLNAEKLAEKLAKKNILCGLPLSRYLPEKENSLLVCVTEKNSRADIDALITALEEETR